jgi:hypothetical protein
MQKYVTILKIYYNEQGIYKEWLTMKYSKDSWISDSKEGGQCGDLNFRGWMVWWKDLRKMVDGCQR